MIRHLAFVAATLLSTCTAPAYAAPAKVTVKDVIDGDTFVIEGEWAVVSGRKTLFKIPGTVKVRVLGIDTPEKGHLAKCPEEAAHSKKAMAFATDLLLGGAVINDVQHDKYGGRIDAVTSVGPAALDFGTAMIAGGYARKYTGEGPKPDWCAILRPASVHLLHEGFE